MKHVMFFLFCVNVHVVFGLNVLFLCDTPSGSHQIWNYELATGLLAKGYNVTMFGASPTQVKGLKNYHVIDVEGLQEAANEDLNLEGLLDVGMYENMRVIYDWIIFNCNYTLNSKALQTLLNYPSDFKFDLIIYDTTANYCLLPLVQRFQYPPTVAVTAFLLPPYLSSLFGNDLQPSYLPFYMLKYGKEVSFFQRLENYFWLQLDMVLRKFYLEKKFEAFVKSKFGEQVDSLDKLKDHVSLLLCNLVQGYHYSQPLTPNIIPVGGLHINPAKKLPDDIQHIMDNAKHGVILFSLGTNLRSVNLKEEKKKALIEAFGQLKQVVLWKFEADLKDLPKNVIARKWLPQREILAHPNLKVFISHGGGLSTIEASYYGIPVVGIPFFADQKMNIQVMKNKDLAIEVDYTTMTSSILLKEIKEILQNPKYSENAKKMANVLKDQPQSSLDRAVFWLEYAIRHNGTHFLDPGSRKLPLLVTSSMDIYLFLLFVSVITTVLSIKIVFCLKQTLCKREPAKKIKKN